MKIWHITVEWMMTAPPKGLGYHYWEVGEPLRSEDQLPSLNTIPDSYLYATL